MVEGITEAQVIERLQRLERNVALLALYAERTGSDFLTAQRTVAGL